MTTYSNPRMNATIENWPHGKQRVTAYFKIEVDHNHDRQRAVRTTTGAPKKLTFARQMRIVDGDDGKTYIAALSQYGHVTIHHGDMKFEHETIHNNDPRFHAARALFTE